MMSRGEGGQRRILDKIPVHGLIGLTLIAVAWPANWLLPGWRTHLMFFPLWLGAILFCDAAIAVYGRPSLWKTQRMPFCVLFLLSVPVWWFFELLNWRTQNWTYLGSEYFTPFQYFLFASLNFSTVIPAVFVAARLAGAWPKLQRFGQLPLARNPGQTSFMSWIVAGAASFGLILLLPRVFYPLVWVAPFLMLDGYNALQGRRSLIQEMLKGNARTLLVFGAAGLLCGAFWEFWNVFSYPKWVYDIPYFGFLHIFEMPILGYLGYIPFAWSLFAFYEALPLPEKYRLRWVEVRSTSAPKALPGGSSQS